MKASWKPQAVKPAFSSQKPRWAKASRSAASRPGPDVAASISTARVSRNGQASGTTAAMTAAITISADAHPQRPIRPWANGTSANWPKPPSAPASPIAQLRRSGGSSRFNAP